MKFINHPPPSNYEKFNNTANFKEFLDDNLKADYYDFDAYLKELVSRHYDTGRASFELGCHETKSGNPVVFDYDVIYYADDNYEETDGWEEEVSQWFEIYIF